MCRQFSPEELKEFKTEDVAYSWWQIKESKNFHGNRLFPNLSQLAAHVLALPHANSDAERIFSIVTDVLTKKRNRLSHEVLNSICIIRSYLQSANKTCVSTKFNENHLAKMTAKQIYCASPDEDNESSDP